MRRRAYRRRIAPPSPPSRARASATTILSTSTSISSFFAKRLITSTVSRLRETTSILGVPSANPNPNPLFFFSIPYFSSISMTVRMLREELQLLQEPGSYVGEVVKVMGKNKVLVKVTSSSILFMPFFLFHFARHSSSIHSIYIWFCWILSFTLGQPNTI